MDLNKTFIHSKTSSPKPRRQQPPLFTSPRNTIAPYILLKLLVKMRDQLSAEATENFTRIYLDMVEEHYPRLKDVVTSALKDTDVQKFYGEMTATKEEL